MGGIRILLLLFFCAFSVPLVLVITPLLLTSFPAPLSSSSLSPRYLHHQTYTDQYAMTYAFFRSLWIRQDLFISSARGPAPHRPYCHQPQQQQQWLLLSSPQ